MTKYIKWLLSVALVSTMITGCKGKNSCVSDSDCGDGQQCKDNACVSKVIKITECKKNTDCPKNTDVCVNNVCIDSTKANYCINDNSCRFGMYCRQSSGDCVECLSSEQCDQTQGHVCRADGTCGESIGCTNDLDCKPLLCRVDTGECVECLNAGQCSDGKVCDLSGYYCRQCHNNQDCGGAECVSGACQNIGECLNSADCSGRACYQGKCTNCLDNNYCSATEYCDPATGFCNEAECQYAQDCKEPTQGCRDRRCVSCITASECRGGETCNNGACSKITGNEQSCEETGCENGLVCINKECQPCTANTQCPDGYNCELTLSPARCVQRTVGSTDLGQPCEDSSNCASGLCVTVAGQTFCSQFCIGSNKGNTEGTNYQRDVDCPLNYKCHAGTAGGNMDGHHFCVHASVLSSDVSYPFDKAPGKACSATDDRCQTECDFNAGKCKRFCRADKDCADGERCHAEYDEIGNPTGVLSCSSAFNSKGVIGSSCQDNKSCQSGVCEGWCFNSQGYTTRLCNNQNDCSTGETCKGYCAGLCRGGIDCASGSVCTPWPLEPVNTNNWDGDLWVNICDNPYYAYCSADSHCSDSFSCNTQTSTCTCNSDDDCSSTSGICINGSCATLGEGEYCIEDANCASEWCSLNNKCTSICAVDADCFNSKAGKRCINTHYVDSSNASLYAIGLCDE